MCVEQIIAVMDGETAAGWMGPTLGWSSDVLSAGPPEAAGNRTKEEKMRSRFAMLLAIAVVCVTTAWAGFAPEEQITTSRTGKDLRMNNGRKVVVAANGVRHLVWSGGAVYYNRYYPGSGWTTD